MPFGLVPIFASSKFNLRDPGFRVLGHELPGKTDSLLLLPRVVCSAVVGQLGALCFFAQALAAKAPAMQRIIAARRALMRLRHTIETYCS